MLRGVPDSGSVQRSAENAIMLHPTVMQIVQLFLEQIPEVLVVYIVVILHLRYFDERA
jgi:hypothetical protein